jgi:hypothetical protein
LDWKQLQRLVPAVRVKVVNLKASYQQALENFSLAGLEVSLEDL